MAADAHLHAAADGLRFGVGLAPTSGVVSTGLPVLDGRPVEHLFGVAEPAGREGPFVLFRSGDWKLGAATVPAGDDLGTVVNGLYNQLFAAARGWQLARIWNYVPAVNETGLDGLENYRAFNHGRSLAFEAAFGGGARAAMPAASAVGTDAAYLVVVFAATTREARHVENPRQVPAYDYPPEHGPRPPSFARATVVPGADGRGEVFISGTSSIRGHATVASGETAAQVACTLENLREISVACGCGPDLARGRARERHFKVYLRHAADLAAVKAGLERALLSPADTVTYLRTDICRRELNVEIEATLKGAEIDD